MARSRNIKPSFFTNDDLGELEPLARLLFIGLWCVADKSGRMIDRPKKIKAEVLPYDNCDCDELLNSLHKKGLIIRYKIDNNNYIQVSNFIKHQHPHIKEPESTIPAPDLHHTCTIQEPNQTHTSPSDSLILIPDFGFPHTDSLNINNNAHARDDLSKVIVHYQDNIGHMLSGAAMMELPEYISTLSAEVVIEAINRAIDANARNWNYIKAILRNWKNSEVKSLGDIKALDDAKEQKHAGRTETVIDTIEAARLANERWGITTTIL